MNYSEDKVAVVTGAGGTLCGPIAVDLAKKGAKVVLIGITVPVDGGFLASAGV